MGYEGAVGHEWRGVRGVMFDSVVSARCYALLSIGNRRVSEYLQCGKCGSERVFDRWLFMLVCARRSLSRHARVFKFDTELVKPGKLRMNSFDEWGLRCLWGAVRIIS